jgi:hypothetical protein
MTNSHDRVGWWDRVVGQYERTDLLGIAGDLPCQGDHAMSGVDEVPGEQPTSATDLDDEAFPFAYGRKQLEDPRSAGIGVEAEAAVVHEREVPPVVRGVPGSHAANPTRRSHGVP